MAKVDLELILKKHKRIALDSMVFIYYFEDNKLYADDCELIFDHMNRNKNVGTTSILTYLEIINLPIKNGHDLLVSEYENLIRNFPNLFTQNLNFEILNETSRLINQFGVHTIDAIQVATGKYFGANLFITNDKSLNKVRAEIDIVCLDELSG